jgi:hypothetical protein
MPRESMMTRLGRRRRKEGAGWNVPQTQIDSSHILGTSPNVNRAT